MNLKIYIIEDREFVACKMKELLENAFSNWSEYFEKIHIEPIDIIEGTRIVNGEDGKHRYYEKDKIINRMTEIVKNHEEDVLGICLDIKLTQEDDEKQSENSNITYDTARELFGLKSESIHICPVTTLSFFDQKSYGILGESVGEEYCNRAMIVDEENESELFSLAYFLCYGKMPGREFIDEIFGYD